MSEVVRQKDSIIYAAAQRMVEVGVDASKAMLDGKQPDYTDGYKLHTVFRAYTKANELEASEVEALLYCMRKLSGAYEFPTVEPLVGKGINYVIEQINVGEGAGGIDLDPAENSVIWSDGETWQVITLQQLWTKLMAL